MFVTHDPIPLKTINSLDFNPTDLLFPGAEISSEMDFNSVSSPECCRLIWFKFEPMVLHVQARDVAKGKEFLELSFGLGFRNSGMVLSNKGRSMVGVRSSAKLVVPIARLISEAPAVKIELLVSRAYLLLLLRLGNQKFRHNFDHMDRYKSAIEAKFSEMVQESLSTNTEACIALKETKEERRQRKKAEGIKRQQELQMLSNMDTVL
ncbi:hypothetical protein DSO57_1021078 [Entomophthora muscae]|uniref:Uncharacterized protein n=1 Tax=Entomophthora muscae TaxID=34485 RepID=A0ACC2SSQ4_9FUNG|nr:hypothetical protein DSO57_1021078 [Entomophthora muscae]